MAKRRKQKSNTNRKNAKNPSKFLATIQIGITLAGFLSSAFASDAFASELAPMLNKIIPAISVQVWNTISIILITIILSFFTLVFGELVPKKTSNEKLRKNSICNNRIYKRTISNNIAICKILTTVTNGVSKLFGVGESDEEIVTEEEIKMMIDQGKEKRSNRRRRKRTIKQCIRIWNITVSEIMTHRKDIFAVDIHKCRRATTRNIRRRLQI